jgi:hypothetical protein
LSITTSKWFGLKYEQLETGGVMQTLNTLVFFAILIFMVFVFIRRLC